MNMMERLGIAGSIAAILSLIAVFIAGIYGWFSNIVAIYHTVDLPITGMFIFRCVGIFVAPIGAVLGYL